MEPAVPTLSLVALLSLAVVLVGCEAKAHTQREREQGQ